MLKALSTVPVWVLFPYDHERRCAPAGRVAVFTRIHGDLEATLRYHADELCPSLRSLLLAI